MGLLNKMMLGCDQASFLVSKKEETKLSFVESIQLKLHLMACKMCKHLEVQNRFINDNICQTTSNKNNSSEQQETMSCDKKAALKELMKGK